MLTNYLALNIDQLVSKVTEHGFCVMDDFVTPANTLALSNEITLLNDHLQMQEAGTGRAHNIINNQLRGDVIYWLNESHPTLAQQAYFSQMEILRASLNQHLYLGLFALESHLALYTAGTGYKKHIDRFKVSSKYPTNQPVRQISCILYLNQDWLAENGGELRLYLNSADETMYVAPIDRLSLDISPLGGRLVVFLSDTFYHEVLPATQDRKSLTGWFLTR
ncbi:MAG TPA: 2OG-Fe(II) oxygenase [Methylotenera sp.]|nr:2OG-Fe(II) oxygenase [Methylotenera sp.]